MADISLSKAVRSNLQSLQGTASMMSKTQDRLSTGNKVNSALDNPTNFFTAQSLNNRANSLNQLMDGMANGRQTIEAADNGLTAVTKNVEQMQSSIRQARQDKSFKGVSFELDTTAATSAGKITIAGTDVSTVSTTQTLTGTFGSTTATALTVQIGSGNAVNVTFGANDSVDTVVSTLNANDVLKGQGFSAAKNSSNQITLTTKNGEAVTLGGANAALIGNGTSTSAYTAKSLDTLVSDVNANTTLNPQVRASNDGGKLRLENLKTSADVTIGALKDGKVNFSAAATGTSTVGKNSVRGDLMQQFNDLRQQLDRTAEDASFNGINLLRGDSLKLSFNETGSSSLSIQSKGGKAINSTNLGIDVQALSAADSDAALDAVLTKLGDALGSLRSQASSFGSNLSVVQNREDFTKSMINTLETGGANLTLADMNQEAANLLALQTRQSLSQSSLSLASQADQSVLQLIR